MQPTQIAAKLTQQFGSAISASLPDDKHPRIHTASEHWRKIAAFLRDDAELAFDFLACVAAVDYVADNVLACVYDLYSLKQRHWFAVKVLTDRAKPSIPSVMDLWPAADWHEREAFDMMGIDFPGHADLRRILLPEDWVGHPLRKDYPLQGRGERHNFPVITRDHS